MGVQSVWGPCQSGRWQKPDPVRQLPKLADGGGKKVWAEEDGRGLGNSRSQDGEALM